VVHYRITEQVELGLLRVHSDGTKEHAYNSSPLLFRSFFHNLFHVLKHFANIPGLEGASSNSLETMRRERGLAPEPTPDYKLGREVRKSA